MLHVPVAILAVLSLRPRTSRLSSRKLLTLNRDRMTQIMLVTFSVPAINVAIPAVCNVNRERIPIDSVKSSLPSFSADKSCQLARLACPDDCGVQSPLSTRSYISKCLQSRFLPLSVRPWALRLCPVSKFPSTSLMMLH